MSNYRFVELQKESASYADKLHFEVKVSREEIDRFDTGEYAPEKVHLMFSLRVNGVPQACYTAPHETKFGPEGAVARAGDLWLSQAAWDAIKTALEKAKANPEYAAQEIAKAAAEKQAAEVDAKYRAHRKAVEDMMTLNGKTY